MRATLSIAGLARLRPGELATAILARLSAALPVRYAGALPALVAGGLTGAATYLLLTWTGQMLRG